MKMDADENRQFAELQSDVKHLIERFDRLEDYIESKSVTREAFENLGARVSLLERIAFGTIGLVGSSLILSILYLVIRKP